MSDEHSSVIKTPKQLIIVVVLAFLIPILTFLMLAQFVSASSTKNDTPEAIAERIKPVATLVVVDASMPRVEKAGQQVFEATCTACHTAGLMAAPKFGDKAAWSKLIARGHDALTQSAIQGVRQMPGRGGNTELSDTEVARAVAYMANKAGANFKEPEAKAQAVAAKVATPATNTASAAAPVVAAAPAPVAQVAKVDASKGKSVYDSACVACHGSGLVGSPKAGDKAAWAPRIKTGMQALYNSALKGKNTMPSKGGNTALADEDVKAAVDYLVGLSK